jgi:hypothetical protein
MKTQYLKSYDNLLEKINKGSYNIKKEDYLLFLEKTKENNIESFFYFSNALFQNKEDVETTKDLWVAKNISYKKFKQLRLANFYSDLYFSLSRFFSTFMSYRADEALQIAYHTKGTYQDKTLEAFKYLEKDNKNE